MSGYSELLKDPRWQRKRLEILDRDNFKCACCGDDKETLHVHHKWYQKGLKPWEYKGPCLVTLCESCHTMEHSLKESGINALIRAYLSNGYMYSELIDVAYDLCDKNKNTEALAIVGETQE